jgi:xanthine dehydrogenase iron-sulfur cluster and FAD-binding subunit A
MPINSKGLKLKTAIFGKTTYIYPDSKKELIEFISKEKNYTVLSGGTDWNLEAEDSNFKEQKILFLNNIKEMSTIKTKTSSFEIGACVTLSKFEELCREFFSPFLDTIIRFGSPQIRTAATVGGNLGTSSPIGDLAPLFFVLEAELSLLGPKGERTIPIKDFFKGYRKNALKRNELIYKVKVPKTKKEDSIFSWKLSKRYDQDISTLSLAAKLKMDKNHTIENIILSAGGVGPTPLLLDKTSKLLKDSNLRFNQNSLITALNHDISPISDLRGTAKYRSAAMVGLIKKMQRSAISGEQQHSIMSI